MAALPGEIQMSAQKISRFDYADDIARLKIELNLPSLDYVDISAQIELTRALKRWPLLANFAVLPDVDAQLLPSTAVRQSKLGALT
jgi:hypothetical protein